MNDLICKRDERDALLLTYIANLFVRRATPHVYAALALRFRDINLKLLIVPHAF